MSSSKITKQFLGVVVVAALAVGVAQARNDKVRFLIKDAMETVDAKAKLTGEIKFFFGAQKTPKVVQKIGTYSSNKKTNFANKSDKEGCERAFLSSMIALQDRARAEGGNAVINIHSYQGNVVFTSETEYECAAGSFVGGVALQGDVVKL